MSAEEKYHSSEETARLLGELRRGPGSVRTISTVLARKRVDGFLKNLKKKKTTKKFKKKKKNLKNLLKNQRIS